MAPPNYIAFAFFKVTLFPFNLHELFRFLIRYSFLEEMKNKFFFVLVLQALLFMSGTVELNSGPDTTPRKKPSFAVWNLDSLPARDFAKIPLIERLQNVNDIDMFESILITNITSEEIYINRNHSGLIKDIKRMKIPLECNSIINSRRNFLLRITRTLLGPTKLLSAECYNQI